MTTRGPRLTYVNTDRYLGEFSTSANLPSPVFRSTSPFQNYESMSDSSPHKYLSGGSFGCVKATTRETPCYVDITVTATPGWRKYTGKCYAGLPSPIAGFNAAGFYNTGTGWPTVLSVSDSSLLAMGEKGWRKFKPTARNGSLGQAILELKDLPEMLQQSNVAKQLAGKHKDLLRLPASQFLNVEFGWLPFLNDVRDFVRNSVNAQKRIDQLARDNGKTVRRSGTISTTNSTQSLLERRYAAETGLDTYFYREVPYVRTDLSIGQRSWFAGAFRYYIQKPTAGALGDFLLATHVNAILYGTDLSPSLLWEITPWSWLADWWSSAGDSIANFFEDSADNLVGEYAYVMCNSFQRMTQTVTLPLMDGRDYTCSSVFDWETKQRMPAAPYGFYLNPPDLTARQVGILTAIGLTKRLRGYK